ncbi:hypothetical protein OC842_001508 [Tilletia horrida]|uniref:Uncharacterized protein n=1 Tax=Tilletia horrida TaxID=155126 RepID=A0AAN6GHF9_9BASI|nr:hypothetical protein OC842_001508 [Tilletia horrida]KAK0550467.1 hypothetical protein OC844_006724 [Tilletia horrida]
MAGETNLATNTRHSIITINRLDGLGSGGPVVKMSVGGAINCLHHFQALHAILTRPFHPYVLPGLVKAGEHCLQSIVSLLPAKDHHDHSPNSKETAGYVDRFDGLL